MQILSNFSLVSNNKIQQNEVKKYNFIKQKEQADSFSSSTKPSFKGRVPVPNKIPQELEKMLKSKNFWGILGATVAATATALWKQITNNGENEEGLTEEQIAELIKANLPIGFNENPNTVASDENVIDITPVTDNSVVSESNNKEDKTKQELHLTTIKLSPEKQKVKHVNGEEDLEKIKKLLAEKLSVKDIAKELDVSTTYIYILMKENNIAPPSKQRLIDAQNLSREEILKLYEENPDKTDKGISWILGISEREMENIRRKYDIPTRRRNTRVKAATKLESPEKVSDKHTEEKPQETQNATKIDTTKTIKENNPVDSPKDEIKDINKEVVKLSKQNISPKQIANKFGISEADVKIILINEIKNTAQRIKELAEKDYTLEQAAEELGKDVQTIIRQANRYGIQFNTTQDKTKVDNTKDAQKTTETENKTEQPESTSDINTDKPTKKARKGRKAEKREEVKIDKQNKTEEIKKDEKIGTPMLTESSKQISSKTFNNFVTVHRVKKAENSKGANPKYLFMDLEFNNETQALIEEIREKYKNEIDIINKNRIANILTRLQKFRNANVAKEDLTPQGYVRYSDEDLLMRYIAMMYKIANTPNIEARIDNIKNRGLLTMPIEDFQRLTQFINESIPENDPTFNKYTECFDTPKCLMEISTLKHKYIEEQTNKIVTQELLDKVNETNKPYFEIDKKTLFLIILSKSTKDSHTFSVPTPEFINPETGTNDVQNDLMASIQAFESNHYAREYFDLVNIYNTYCGENHDRDLAANLLKDLKSIEKPSNFTVEKLEELRSIINTYKLGVVPEGRTTEVADITEVEGAGDAEQDTSSAPQLFEALQAKLTAFYETGKYNKELDLRICEFNINVKSDTDLEKLQEFIKILDKISSGEISIAEANKICRENNIQPANSQMQVFLEEEALEDEMSQSDDLRNEIRTTIDSIRQKAYDKKEILDLMFLIDGKTDNLELNELKALNDLINLLSESLKYKKETDSIIKELKDNFLKTNNAKDTDSGEETDGAETTFQEYKKFLEDDSVSDDEYKNSIKKQYKNKADMSLESACNCLMKIDNYNALSEEDKTHITKILEIFDKDVKGAEKRLLEKILENEYIKKSSFIYNEYLKEYIEIHPDAKKDIWGQFTDGRIEILRQNEHAGQFRANGGSGNQGIEFLDDDEYDAWIRILGVKGNTRIASKKIKGQHQGDKEHNLCFDTFFPDHKKNGKIGRA